MKVAPSFIKNKHVKLYFLDIANDGVRPIIRINVIDRSQQVSLPPPPQSLVFGEISNNEELDDYNIHGLDHNEEYTMNIDISIGDDVPAS